MNATDPVTTPLTGSTLCCTPPAAYGVNTDWMRRNTATTKSANGFGGATGATGDVATFPALRPKIDNTTVTIAVNGVTTACDTGATADTDDTDSAVKLTGVVVAAGEIPDAGVLAAVDDVVAAEDAEVEDSAAFSSGLLGNVEEAGGVTAAVPANLEEVAAAVVAAGVGVSVDVGAGAAVVAATAASVGGVVGAAVVGTTGSDVADAAVDEELDADDGLDVVSVDSPPELLNVVLIDSPLELPTVDEVVEDGEVVLAESAPDVPVKVVLVDSETPPEMLEEGEVVLVEVVPEVAEVDTWVAESPPAVVLEVLPSLLELPDDEEPDAAAGSAWARPEPLISAAPRPTVNAEFVTHVGT